MYKVYPPESIYLHCRLSHSTGPNATVNTFIFKILDMRNILQHLCKPNSLCVRANESRHICTKTKYFHFNTTMFKT